MLTILTVFQVTTQVLTASLKGKQKYQQYISKQLISPQSTDIVTNAGEKSQLITEQPIQLFCP